MGRAIKVDTQVGSQVDWQMEVLSTEMRNLPEE